MPVKPKTESPKICRAIASSDAENVWHPSAHNFAVRLRLGGSLTASCLLPPERHEPVSSAVPVLRKPITAIF